MFWEAFVAPVSSSAATLFLKSFESLSAELSSLWQNSVQFTPHTDNGSTALQTGPHSRTMGQCGGSDMGASSAEAMKSLSMIFTSRLEERWSRRVDERVDVRRWDRQLGVFGENTTSGHVDRRVRAVVSLRVLRRVRRRTVGSGRQNGVDDWPLRS